MSPGKRLAAYRLPGNYVDRCISLTVAYEGLLHPDPAMEIADWCSGWVGMYMVQGNF